MTPGQMINSTKMVGCEPAARATRTRSTFIVKCEIFANVKVVPNSQSGYEPTKCVSSSNYFLNFDTTVQL